MVISLSPTAAGRSRITKGARERTDGRHKVQLKGLDERPLCPDFRRTSEKARQPQRTAHSQSQPEFSDGTGVPAGLASS